jgi:hypothetical protein
MFVGIVQSITVIAACVLGVAGLQKLRAPATADAALRAQGIRAPAGAARLLGVVELGVAWAAIVGWRAGHGAMALLYLAFAGFLLRAIRHHAPCGCLGRDDSPATSTQAGLDVAFAISAALALAVEPLHVGSMSTTAIVAFAIVVGLGITLTTQIIGPLAALMAQTRRVGR